MIDIDTSVGPEKGRTYSIRPLVGRNLSCHPLSSPSDRRGRSLWVRSKGSLTVVVAIFMGTIREAGVGEGSCTYGGHRGPESGPDTLPDHGNGVFRRNHPLPPDRPLTVPGVSSDRVRPSVPTLPTSHRSVTHRDPQGYLPPPSRTMVLLDCKGLTRPRSPEPGLEVSVTPSRCASAKGTVTRGVGSGVIVLSGTTRLERGWTGRGARTSPDSSSGRTTSVRLPPSLSHAG